MKRVGRFLAGWLIMCLLAVGAWAQEQETVVITKTRLAELERKEAELEQLKRELGKATDEKKETRRDKSKLENESRNLTDGKPVESRAGSAPTNLKPPTVAPTSPSISTLAPLQDGQIVEAADLLTHYRSEPVAAAKRYEQSRLRVAGEIVGFDKPLLVRHATITLKTSEQSWRVVCRLDPPANLPNLFTAKNGDELVGSTSAGARSVLANVGQRAVIEGWCQGLKGQGVTLTSAKLINVQ